MTEAAAFGFDAGSTSFKALAVNRTGAVVARVVEPSEPLITPQSERLWQELRRMTGAPETVPVAATGYGRKRIRADRILTEITCHARGAYQHTQRPGVLIDIGGQDTKIIRIGSEGQVTDFTMNDKCAAGTGRFLEVILGRLRVPLSELGPTVARARRAVPVSSTCTVFAESEVVSLVAQGEPVEDIVKGLLVSLASRVKQLMGRPEGTPELFMSGGVALSTAMVATLSETFQRPVSVLPDPQFVGAYGAALSLL